MRGIDIGILLAVIGLTAGGVLYVAGIRQDVATLQVSVGDLTNRVNVVAPLDAIREATVEATATIREAGTIRFEEPERFNLGGGNRGIRSLQLIPVSEGFCYLTYIAGDLNGNGEWVRISQKGDHWYLESRSRQGAGRGALVHTDAHCLRYPAQTAPDIQPTAAAR